MTYYSYNPQPPKIPTDQLPVQLKFMINLLLCFGWKFFHFGDAKGCYKQKSGYPEIVKPSELSSSQFRPFLALLCVGTLTNTSLAVMRDSGMETQFEREVFQSPYFKINI